MNFGYLREQPGEPKAMYDGHNEALIELADKNEDLILLYADFAQGKAGQFYRKYYSNRIYNLGIAEANMFGVAAGLSASGKIPFTHCHSIFAIGKAYNQIRQIAFDRYNVKMMLCNSGIFWTFMGASHQIIEDIASLRAIPNLVVISPSDAIEAKKATIASVNYGGPIAIRLVEPKVPIIYKEDCPYVIGEGVTLQDGSDISIITTGITVLESLEASISLKKEGIEARVINLHTIKPSDDALINKAAKETGAIVTVEDSNIFGGLGSLVAEIITESYPVPIRRIGVRDKFGQTGEMGDLKIEYNISRDDIIKVAKELLSN